MAVTFFLRSARTSLVVMIGAKSVPNISAEDFLKLGYQRGDMLKVTIAGRELEMPFVKTFSDVPLKQPLLYIDSRGRASFALNQSSFAAVYDIRPPQPIFIPRKGH